MFTLVTWKLHSQMNIVVVILHLLLFCCRIVAIGAEMQNLEMNFCHVSPRVAWVAKFFWAHCAPIQSVHALFGKSFHLYVHLLMPVFLSHVIPKILFSSADMITQVTGKVRVIG